MLDLTYRIWLVQYLLSVFSPTAALYYVLSKNYMGQGGFNLGGPSRLALCLIATPFFWFVFGRVKDWSDSVNAWKLGARVPPLIRGKRFGDVDLATRYVMPCPRCMTTTELQSVIGGQRVCRKATSV